MKHIAIIFIACLIFLFSIPNIWAQGEGSLESKARPSSEFKFVKKPLVARNGDQISISFESKAFCDATVAIEDPTGKILRHLASGVLGANAPKPFKKNSKVQTLLWDGKDDKGYYVENKDDVTVRVSLGLKPRFERTLLWSPKRRGGRDIRKGVAIRAAPEGVYVFDGGQATDHIRLFSHAGAYLRTVYPFPAGKVKEVKGLYWHTFPQDGRRLPMKPSYQMSSLLTSGDNALRLNFRNDRYLNDGSIDPSDRGKVGYATTDLAISGGHIALAANRLNRLATDGTSGGLNAYGPWVCLKNEKGIFEARKSALATSKGGYELLTHLKPHRFSFGPDGHVLYLTRYLQNYSLAQAKYNYWHHGLFRLSYADDKDAELFLGAAESGSDNRHFNMPADVVCDAKGRICVADMGNHRIQIFSAEGKYLKTIPVEAPAQVAVSPKGELYVFTWELLPEPGRNAKRTRVKRPYTLRKFKSVDDPKLLATYELPLALTVGLYGQRAEIDFWAKPLTLWLNPWQSDPDPRDKSKGLKTLQIKPKRDTGIAMLSLKDDKWVPSRNFWKEAEAAVLRSDAPDNNRQLLYCNPVTGDLYVGESRYDFMDVIKINPVTGESKEIPLPFDVEDMCFDRDGYAYLRTYGLAVRYDPASNWREIPWDYGEERERVTTVTSKLVQRTANVMSGLPLPTNIGWHHGGMHVAPNGKLVVGCLYRYKPQAEYPRGTGPLKQAKSFKPRLYPGRLVGYAHHAANYIHVWDKHGQVVHEDAIPGLGVVQGVAIDNQDSIYVLSSSPRIRNRKKPFNYLAGTLMKFRPGMGRIVCDSPRAPVPLTEAMKPDRDPDLLVPHGNAWVKDAEWFLGGIGWHGKNHGLGCACRNTRFALDYFGRSFAPEVDRYSVAVVDTNGNEIVRIGTYGNVDDGMPLNKEGGPPTPRSIGGDEVALMHAAYTAVDTDNRLFLSDSGNYRILSVKLGYHAEEKVALKNVKDLKK